MKKFAVFFSLLILFVTAFAFTAPQTFAYIDCSRDSCDEEVPPTSPGNLGSGNSGTATFSCDATPAIRGIRGSVKDCQTAFHLNQQPGVSSVGWTAIRNDSPPVQIAVCINATGAMWSGACRYAQKDSPIDGDPELLSVDYSSGYIYMVVHGRADAGAANSNNFTGSFTMTRSGPPPSRFVCESNACVMKNGEGSDYPGCGYNGQSCGVDPFRHLACDKGACVWIPNGYPNQPNDDGCTVFGGACGGGGPRCEGSGGQTRNGYSGKTECECSWKQDCAQGANSCWIPTGGGSGSSDCESLGPACRGSGGQTRNGYPGKAECECSWKQECAPVGSCWAPTGGENMTSDCSIFGPGDDDSSGPIDDPNQTHHWECRTGTCSLVEGKGAHTCNLDIDCQPSPVCTSDGACTLSFSPGNSCGSPGDPDAADCGQPPPSCSSFRSSSSRLTPPNTSTQLSWTCRKAHMGCTITPGNIPAGSSGGGGATGTVTVSPTQTTTYVMTCTGRGGTAQYQTTVRVYRFEGGVLKEVGPQAQ